MGQKVSEQQEQEQSVNSILQRNEETVMGQSGQQAVLKTHLRGYLCSSRHRLGSEGSRQMGQSEKVLERALGVFQGREGGQWAWCTVSPASRCELTEGFAVHREGDGL